MAKAPTKTTARKKASPSKGAAPRSASKTQAGATAAKEKAVTPKTATKADAKTKSDEAAELPSAEAPKVAIGAGAKEVSQATDKAKAESVKSAPAEAETKAKSSDDAPVLQISGQQGNSAKDNSNSKDTADTKKGSSKMAETTEKMKYEADTMVAKAKEYASEFGSKAKASATEMGTFTKENFEAMVESGKIASEGTTEIAKDNMAFTKKSIEDFTSTAKEMASVKNPSEFIKKQGDYVRKSFDESMAQMTKSTEAFMKVMGDAYQPISNRVSVASEKVKSVAA